MKNNFSRNPQQTMYVVLFIRISLLSKRLTIEYLCKRDNLTTALTLTRTKQISIVPNSEIYTTVRTKVLGFSNYSSLSNREVKIKLNTIEMYQCCPIKTAINFLVREDESLE